MASASVRPRCEEGAEACPRDDPLGAGTAVNGADLERQEKREGSRLPVVPSVGLPRNERTLRVTSIRPLNKRPEAAANGLLRKRSQAPFRALLREVPREHAKPAWTEGWTATDATRPKRLE